MKDFMDYVKDLPAIQKAAAQFQQEEIEFLKNKLDLTQKIAEVQKSGGGAQSSGGAGRGGQQGVFTDANGNVLVDTGGAGQRRQEEQEQTQQSQAPQAIPTGGGTPPVQRTVPVSPTGGGGTTGAATGLPQSDRMQNLLEHRAQLGQQVNDPRVLFEHMRQRGLVTEGVEGNAPKYTVQVGNQRVSADELMSNPTLQSKALDHLAEQTLPSSNENGGLLGQGSAISGVAQNLLRSLGPGTSATENMKGAGEAASKIGAMGSLGNIAKAVGKIALPIGVAAGAMALVQSGGEMYQNVENLGQTHNQGFSGGLGYDMGIRSMAMNPFITTEQARQITMGALNLGYTGKEFDTVTQFMAQNLTDMNMSVADSVKLLNTNVIQGGASIQSLGTQLQSLQQLSGGSTSTNTQLQQAFEAASKNLVSQGVGGNQAGAIALNLAGWNQQQVNGGPNPLAQSTQTTFNNMASNPAFLQLLGQQYAPGVEYPGVLSYLSNQKGGTSKVPQDFQNVLVQIVKRFPAGNSPQSKQNAISNFMLYVNQAFGAGWSENDAQLWYNELTGPQSGLPNNQVSQQNQQLDATTPNTNQATSSGGKAAGETGNDPVLGTNPASGAFSNTTLTNLVNKYGYNSVVVYDPSGKAQTLDFSNKAMMTGIGNNTWKVGVKNSSGNVGTPADIDDWRTGVATPGGNDAGGNSSGSAGTTSGTFDLTPAAAQLLKLLPGGGTVGTGSNTVAANTGTNGVTPNSASVAYPSH